MTCINWINISDKYPPENIRLLVVVKTNFRKSPAQYAVTKGMLVFGNWIDDYCGEIIYWAYMPELPKELTNEQKRN